MDPTGKNADSVLGASKSRGAVLGCAIILLALVACNSLPATITPVPPTASASPSAEATLPAATASSTPPLLPENGTITLTVWAPEEFSPESTRGGAVLQRQIQDFQTKHPGIRVNYVIKSGHGSGGLLDFLLKVQSLVPSRLPDIIVIDSREMDTAARAELLQPLDHDLPAGAMADLPPPAAKLARFEGRWLGMPATLELQHLVYSKDALRTPPATWDQLLAGNASFAFPADDDDAFLFQYLENRGRLSPAGQTAPLDIAVTTSVLTFYQRARSAHLVPDSVLALKAAQVWSLFAQNQVVMAQVEASSYLAEHAKVPNSGYAPIPTADGNAAALVNTWNFAILASDPRRHAAAGEYLNWLSEPGRMTDWATAAQLLPARRSAFVNSVGPIDYADFLRRLLDASISAPTFAERARYQAGWHNALQSVLRGQATPSEAALRAAQAVP